MKKIDSKSENLLRQKLANNETEVYFDEMDKVGLKHDEETISINENVNLQRVYMFKAYRIQFKDRKRDFENRVLNDYVDSKNVISALSEYKFSNSKYNLFKKNIQAEVEWAKDLENHLKKYFVSVRRGNPRKPLEIDLDLGSGKVGLELKWADKINKNNPMQAVFGQMSGYCRNGNYETIILVVAGEKKLKQDSIILQLENLVKRELNCLYFYLTII